MRNLWWSAPALLVVTGGMLGLSLPFGKLATENGVSGTLWSLVISLGAGTLLAVVLALNRIRLPLAPRALRFFAIAAAVSYALPNVLMFTAMPHLGAGYLGIMYTISPIFTLLLSAALGVRRPNRLGIVGVLIGFAGALMVASTRGEAGQPADLFWVGVGFTIPFLLATGNVYRTIDRPEGVNPVALAAGSHLAAAAMLGVALVVTTGGADVGRLADMPALVIAQALSAAAMFAVYFRLQDVGGPVYLSQIGYVAAAVGLVSGTLFLGERYLLITWVGAAVIMTGVAIASYAQRSS